jgi:hypothetical protein
MTWFHDWLAIHLRRHVSLGLPSAADNFDLYEAWRLEFGRLKINEAAANNASLILASRSHAKWNHFPLLVRLAMKAMDHQNRSREPRAASGPCEHCDGHGTVEVIDDAWGYRWGAFCICDYGRARMHQTLESFKADGKTVLDYAVVMEGRPYNISRSGETRRVVFRQAHTDDEYDYAYFLPPGHLRDLADKLRPPGMKRAPSPATQEHSNAQDLPDRAARRDEDARRANPRALPAHPHAAKPALDRPPVRAGG